MKYEMKSNTKPEEIPNEKKCEMKKEYLAKPATLRENNTNNIVQLVFYKSFQGRKTVIRKLDNQEKK